MDPGNLQIPWTYQVSSHEGGDVYKEAPPQGDGKDKGS